jgi:soluble lytic murein transglycosylase
VLPGTVRLPSRRVIILGSQAILALALVVMLLQRSDVLPSLPTVLPPAPTAAVPSSGAGSEAAPPVDQTGANTSDASAGGPAVDVVSYANLVPTAAGSADATTATLVARAQRLRRSGDASDTLDVLDQLDDHIGDAGLGPYLPLERAWAYGVEHDWKNELKAATNALAIDGGGPRLARIDAFERSGEANVALGNITAALDAYSQALDLAGTPAYRAEMLYTTGRLAHQAGRDDLAVERLRALIVELPNQSRAADALDYLETIGETTSISPLQAGLARAGAGQYHAALTQFEQVDDASPDAGAAHVGHANALHKLGRDDEALAEAQTTAATYPDQAGPALLLAGRILEQSGQYADAAMAYASVLERAPGSASLPEAMLRAGLSRYALQDWASAATDWQQGSDAAGAAPPALRAELRFWLGKALARESGAASPEARSAWSSAFELAPDSVYGLRAQDMLRGETVPNVATPSGPPQLVLPSDQEQERLSWLQSRNLTPQQVANDLLVTPELARAQQLLQVGLTSEAGWEIEGLGRTYAANNDLAHLDALGEWAQARGLPDQALAIGRLADTAAGGAPLPRPLLRSLYPAGFGDVASMQATNRGVDPLLLLAVVRQESGFEPRAQSPAGAIGLAQVLPATGRLLAQQLGVATQLDTSDLYEPELNLNLGAAYLAIVEQQFDRRLYPVLASYNAGSSTVDQWERSFGDDPDLLLELAPYEETHTYLANVYVNYREYQKLYAP